jgi:hypothetical protein
VGFVVASQKAAKVPFEKGIPLPQIIFSERIVKSRRPSKARPGVNRPAPKPLDVRYAELLRLRQTIREIQTVKTRDHRSVWK